MLRRPEQLLEYTSHPGNTTISTSRAMEEKILSISNEWSYAESEIAGGLVG